MKQSFCLSIAGVTAFAAWAGAVGAPADAAALRAQIDRLRAAYAAQNRPLGVADAEGVYHLTAEGRRLESLEAKYRAAKGETDDEATAAGYAAGWGFAPLGPKGTLTLPSAFKNAPSFQPPPVRRPGLTLFGGGVKAAVCAETTDRTVRSLADEFAWHLSKMTGEPFTVTHGPAPARGPAVVFRCGAGTVERALVRREGERLIIGGVGPGVGHATTYVLEALGCRYLWPGESGKIIPRRRNVTVPELTLDFTPRLKIRGVRAGGRGMSPGGRWHTSLLQTGFVPEQIGARLAAAQRDRKGNRGFWEWHGVNDSKSVNGYCSSEAAYRWGHYYGDYPTRYAQTHPEWFALQPDGRRIHEYMSRPTFCLSNRALSDETARNLLAAFRAAPGQQALSACLPDGGYSSPCMCEACRRLDPVNAPGAKILFVRPKRRRAPYVSLTDRTFDFFNRIAAGVVAERPGAKVCVYAYSAYCSPPVATAPHPALVILSVAGNYTAAKSRGDARRNLAAWSSFGNELLWRPNALGGYRTTLVQNFARPLFADMEVFKVNGLVGTDFDCMDDNWSLMGLTYYMLAKSFLNPDRLTYDALYADYLAAAFGPAADEMRVWYDAVEKTMDAAAALPAGKTGAGGRVAAYARALDLVSLERGLARAETAAAGRPDVLRRLALLRTGLTYTSWKKRELTCPPRDKDRLKAIRRGFYDFMHAAAATPDGLVAVNPSRLGFLNSGLKAAHRAAAEERPAR